ncbi:MAG: DMT family transporter [Stellaceae bacterium]
MSENSASPVTAALAAVLGSVMVGLMPLLARHLYAAGIDPASMLLWRYVLALVPLSLAIAVLRIDLGAAWRGGAWQIVVIGMTLGAAQTLCFWESIKTLDTSIAVLLFYTYPVLTLALERVVLGRPIRLRAAACIAAILCGAALITIPGVRGGAINLHGLAWAIPAPLIYAVYLVLTASLLRRHPPLIGAVCLYSGMAVVFGAGAMLNGLDWPADRTSWLLLVFIALGPGALMITLFSYSAPRLGPSSYAIIANVELVTVVTIGVTVLGEKITPWRAIGGGLIIGGILAHGIFGARGGRSRRRALLPSPASGEDQGEGRAATPPSAAGS